MEIYGVVKEGKVIEKFTDKESSFNRAVELGIHNGYGSRKLFFNELNDYEKIETLELRLNELKEFLEKMKDSGRTYSSHTNIYFDELEWLLSNTKQNVGL